MVVQGHGKSCGVKMLHRAANRQQGQASSPERPAERMQRLRIEEMARNERAEQERVIGPVAMQAFRDAQRQWLGSQALLRNRSS